MPNKAFLDTYRENGKRIKHIRNQVATYAQTHHSLEDIDAYAEKLILKADGEPAFKRVPKYNWSTCISVNSGIVHGIPQGTIKSGDLVSIDIGMYYQGTTTDTATSFVIGQATPSQQKFLRIGQKALAKAIKAAQPNKPIKNISKVIQTTVEKAGYNVSRTLTGHGLGETMHEEPPIPCFVNNHPKINQKLKVGMVLALEVIYMQGNWQLKLDPDGWTLRTQDNSLSAVFENDVIINPNGPEVIT